jgi:hypothetical protein
LLTLQCQSQDTWPRCPERAQQFIHRTFRQCPGSRDRGSFRDEVPRRCLDPLDGGRRQTASDRRGRDLRRQQEAPGNVIKEGQVPGDGTRRSWHHFQGNHRPPTTRMHGGGWCQRVGTVAGPEFQSERCSQRGPCLSCRAQNIREVLAVPVDEHRCGRMRGSQEPVEFSESRGRRRVASGLDEAGCSQHAVHRGDRVHGLAVAGLFQDTVSQAPHRVRGCAGYGGPCSLAEQCHGLRRGAAGRPGRRGGGQRQRGQRDGAGTGRCQLSSFQAPAIQAIVQMGQSGPGNRRGGVAGRVTSGETGQPRLGRRPVHHRGHGGRTGRVDRQRRNPGRPGPEREQELQAGGGGTHPAPGDSSAAGLPGGRVVLSWVGGAQAQDKLRRIAADTQHRHRGAGTKQRRPGGGGTFVHGGHLGTVSVGRVGGGHLGAQRSSHLYTWVVQHSDARLYFGGLGQDDENQQAGQIPALAVDQRSLVGAVGSRADSTVRDHYPEQCGHKLRSFGAGMLAGHQAGGLCEQVVWK